MKNKISIFLILIIFNSIIFATINVISETRNNNIIIWDKDFSGEIIQNNTKIGYADGNGYILIEKPYIVEKGNTLKIEQGLTIEFGSNLSRLVINGTLLALGTENDPIIFSFRDKNITQETHNWAIMNFYSSKGSIITYCNFNYIMVGVSTVDTEIAIENCYFTNIYGNCINCYQSDIIFKNNTIINNFEYYRLIYLVRCKAFIQNNNIIFNEGTGIYLSTPEKTFIIENKIENNYKGIWIVDMDSIENRIIINNNSINNTQSNLYYYLLHDIIINAEYNYWGTIDEKNIESMMDIHKDSKGSIDFEPWLDENGNVCTTEKDDGEKKENIFIELISIFIILIIIIIGSIIIWYKKRTKKLKSKKG